MSLPRNEPIVQRPEEAVECFLRTDMDVLVLGPFVVRKTPARDRAPTTGVAPGRSDAD